MAVLNKIYQNVPLKNISETQYTFDQLLMALKDNIQIECEIENPGSSPKAYYDQISANVGTYISTTPNIHIVKQIEITIDHLIKTVCIDRKEDMTGIFYVQDVDSEDSRHETETRAFCKNSLY